ncbi:MAG: DUF1622 domain-containing protein [Chloroflexi bacterium]|jgi:uncharacterized membrane protein|nr:DUF1622 domain-containing protein [Anaerolineaceae bacterium]NLI45169.1 DUF1622 domain-containing protein [Chloroflexota bacterium]HOT25241.1 DUF1622 domain-containing protein [Anaerolineaceae bacterium]HQH57819.1 DUF1622 domain-containing protein [Anaerolineaceae bacterium]HQL28169.1 DUF1622 domain-containing protein [Anaerolineaceae bacterium]
MSEMKPSNHSLWAKLGGYYLPTLLIVGLILILTSGLKNHVPATESYIPHEELLTKAVGYAALFCEGAAIFVIVTGVAHALASYIRRIMDRSLVNQIKGSEATRLRLGHKLSLSLEFAMASDILRLAVAPSFSTIIVLTTIVLLRVLLNYFLEHDIEVIREYNILPELEQFREENN